MCVYVERSGKSLVELPYQKLRHHFFQCCHGILTPLHLIHFIQFLLQSFRLLLHLPFITIFSHSLCFLFFLLLFFIFYAKISFYYFVRFSTAQTKRQINKFLLLAQFTKVTFIKYTFRSFSGNDARQPIVHIRIYYM